MARRRTRTAAGAAAPRAAAPRAKRARKTSRRRRMTPGLALGLVPGLALDQELKIAPGNQAPRAVSQLRARTRGLSPRGAPALVPAPPLNPNPEPGLNQSPNPNHVPPHLPKPAPAPARSPAPNPTLPLAPVPALSSYF